MLNKGLTSMSIDLAQRYLDEAHNATIDDNITLAMINLMDSMNVIEKILSVLQAEKDGEYNER